MPFELIDNLKKPAAAKCPEDGVRVMARKLGRPGKAGGGIARYIAITIGARLARSISLHAADHRVRMLFGTGSDAGKIMVSVDNTAGNFAAKRSKSGAYTVTINELPAKDLFALEFPEFCEAKIDAIRPENGKPPQFVFKASKEMLEVEDD